MATDEEKRRWQRELWRQARARYYAAHRKEPRPLKDTPENIYWRKYHRRRYWEQKGRDPSSRDD